MARARVNPKWFQVPSTAKLAEYLPSVPSFELTKKVASLVSESAFLENPRTIVIENFILLTKDFMKQVFEELRDDLEKHAYNYPFLTARIPFLDYESSTGRLAYERLQSRLRKIPGLGSRYKPRKMSHAVVPIILPGR